MSIPGVYHSAEDAAGSVTKGIDKIWAYDNIAIVVLMVCFLLSVIANAVQYRSNSKRMDKMFERDVVMAQSIRGLEASVDKVKTVFNFILDNFKIQRDD